MFERGRFDARVALIFMCRPSQQYDYRGISGKLSMRVRTALEATSRAATVVALRAFGAELQMSRARVR